MRVIPTSILVVDDEKLIRWSLREHLRHAGYDVVLADSGRETMKTLDERVALVLLDLRLPDVGGLELCDEILRRRPGCRVIMMTAQWTPELVREALAHGVSDVLQKPFDLDEMTRAVATALA
ncbi:MAG TPA: response regulator [Candidatus Polarisedimenticolaceae bacterium]|nr:response regulator [Candidatus Polarisedimenticolaceae bacterium]